jgi:hypothetical protein
MFQGIGGMITKRNLPSERDENIPLSQIDYKMESLKPQKMPKG